ncbi:hypothetical protein LJR296_008116 [Cupriavidus necator]|uniref:hypothetical protein n=1 Tax=Cupriavidus necator TaxID=106590 RepID=UPI003ED07FD2
MASNLSSLLPSLLPGAVAWAESMAEAVIRNGSTLFSCCCVQLGRVMAMSKKALLLGAVCVAFVSSASAQTSYSFNGLVWGATPAQVEARLKASNLTLDSLPEKLACKIRSSCSLSFSGLTIHGEAEFANGGLSAVRIFTSGDTQENGDRLDSLRRRYGLPTSITKGRSKFDLDLYHWRSASGETILYDGGYLLYRSPSASRANDADAERSRIQY